MTMADHDDGKAFLGRGWAFPVRISGGEIATVAHEDDIAEAIRLVLDTTPGERVMRPDFGAGLRALAFEPINTTTIALARHRVEEALIRWEPRIDVEDVSVTPDEQARGRLLIEIRYRVRASNTFYNLVYPFYLMEGERT
jgi:phage baseplate assembly protein W